MKPKVKKRCSKDNSNKKDNVMNGSGKAKKYIFELNRSKQTKINRLPEILKFIIFYRINNKNSRSSPEQ